MNIQHFFDPETSTLTYVLSDPDSKDSIIIDPVLNFDPLSETIEEKSLLSVLDYIKSEALNVQAILETHAHADHISGSQKLKEYFPKALVGIGRGICEVQKCFKAELNLSYQKTDGIQFDLLFEDQNEYKFGTLTMKAYATPGHTPACMTYQFDDVLFCGDALFMPDSGTGRCDFPQGSAKELYNSVRNIIFNFPENYRIFVGHDYCPNGRELRFETTVAESKLLNIHLTNMTTEKDYIEFRETRDKTLKPPRLLYPSIQININGGKLPPDSKLRFI